MTDATIDVLDADFDEKCAQAIAQMERFALAKEWSRKASQLALELEIKEAQYQNVLVALREHFANYPRDH